ncbi:MAG TPA: FAD-binding protein, partial [Streptosporangiaceae bacterium]
MNAPQGGRPSRRTVLLAATAAIAGGSGVAAVAVGLSRALRPGPAAGTGSQGGGSTAPASPVRASPAGGPRAPDWAALGRELPPGALLRPGDRGYPAARLLFDPRFDGLRPAGIVSCATAANVASCISFARRFGLPIAARSGGHSYAGWSSTTGLMVDVGPMQSLRADGSRVTVGAGL